jgi:hypothetical protein
LGVVALGLELWAFVDALTRPGPRFAAAGKASKTVWLVLTGIAAAIGLAEVWPGSGLPSIGGIASIAAVVVAAVYLVDVRRAVRGSGGAPGRAGPPAGW